MLEKGCRLPFSYREVGITHPDARLRHPPPGYKMDHYRARLGGAEAFSRAKAAVNALVMYGAPWLELHPPGLKVEPGATFGILARHLGFYSLSTARIIYVIDTPTRYGFAIGTLPGHLERGEERFLVELQGDSVWYDLLAFSRPQHPLVWLGYPFARHMQRRFARDSAGAMRRRMR